MRVLARFFQRLRAALHAICGWVCFRLGLRLQSRHHYERVLQLQGDHFGAYVHLGRIAFAVGDYTGWRREFAHAKRTDAAAFARLRYPIEHLEPRLAGIDTEPNRSQTGYAAADDRATWRSPVGPGQSNGDSSGGNDSLPREGMGKTGAGGPLRPAASTRGLEAGGLEAGDCDDLVVRGDDCVSPGERSRLRQLGPIRPEEVRRCDFDELARRLGS